MNPYNPTRKYLLAQCGLGAQFVRGSGHFLYDANGQQYLDFLSQYGVASLGHNHPELVEALTEWAQSGQPQMIQPFTGEATEQLAETLRDVTPGDLGCTVFTNSGAEAAEAAIKLARARTGRPTILSTIGGFHGKTLGALSATGNPVYQALFNAPAPGFDYVPYGDLDVLAEKLHADGDHIAAFMVEPVQGEGGMVPAPDGYLAGVVDVCRSAGVLTVFDEVQTGLGRTGTLFAAEAAGVAPDIMLLGKALGGALMPIAACICTPKAWDHGFGMLHSSTFAGNQLACAVGLRVIDLLLRDDQRMVAHVANMGEYLLGRLRELAQHHPQVIKEARGRGLMAGLEFHRFDGEGSFAMGFASRAGLLTILLSGYLLQSHRIVTAAVFNDAHFLRLEPPFTVDTDEIDRAINAIATICQGVEDGEVQELFRHLTDVPQTPRPDGLYVSAASDMRERHEPTSQSGTHTFAFMGHYIDESDYVRVDPAFAKYSPERLARWRQWVAQVGPGILDHVEALRSASGETVDGWLLAVPMLPMQLLELGRKEMIALFQRTIDMAKRRGAKILGLGGFNSVITRGGQRVVGKGIAVTTGNTLSSVMAADGIRKAAAERGVDLSTAHVAAIGATGAIGRLASLLLAPEVGRLTLIGNSLSPDAPQRCRAVAGDVYRHLLGHLVDGGGQAGAGGAAQQSVAEAVRAEAARHHGDTEDALARWIHQHLPPDHPDRTVRLTAMMEEMLVEAGRETLVRHTCDLAGTVDDADIILLATSSDQALIHPEHLKPNAIVCDVARPSNVAADLPQQRPDVLIFEGGLVQLPHPVNFGGEFQILPEGTTLGCLAETILLALEGDFSDHSIGQRLDVAEAEYLACLASKHGFVAASPELCRKS